MPKFKSVFLSLCAAAALSACQTQSGAGFERQAAQSYTIASDTRLDTTIASEGEILATLNAERKRAGLSPVSYNGQLTRAARSHASDLARNNQFSHEGSNGSSVADRVRSNGYKFCRVSENISKGHYSAQSVTAGWMNSAGHRRNILDRDVSDIGIGIAEGALYVTVFAKPC